MRLLSSCPKNHSCAFHEPLLYNKGEEKYVGLFFYHNFAAARIHRIPVLPQDPWTAVEKKVPKQVLINCTYAIGALQEMSQMSCLWCTCYAIDLLWPLILRCPDSCAYIDWFGAPHTKQDSTNIDVRSFFVHAQNCISETYLSRTIMPPNQYCVYGLFKTATFCVMNIPAKSTCWLLRIWLFYVFCR